MLKEIIIAVQSYFKAHQFIRKHNLWKWIIIPGLIYAVLFVVSMYFFSKSATYAIELLSIKTGLKAWVDRMQSGLVGFFFALGGVMVWLILILLYFSWFKYIWLIVGSPLFGYLSEKTESIIDGKEYAFSFPQLIKDMSRGIRLAMRNVLWQTVYAVTLLIISFVPLAGWITPLIVLMIECYYYGFSMLDYSCERQKLSASQSIEFIGQHKGLAIGNGLIFYLMHGLVGIGWVLAPAYAVIAATLSLYHPKEEG
ncbi:MAG: EI24 domain-containing protein [Chitinophagaceae bacterium]|nr:EI24 domain-containing protein [Chitinophagaceae bacterium]